MVSDLGRLLKNPSGSNARPSSSMLFRRQLLLNFGIMRVGEVGNRPLKTGFWTYHVMPKIYRAMRKADDGKPLVDATGKGLGVRGEPVNGVVDVISTRRQGRLEWQRNVGCACLA